MKKLLTAALAFALALSLAACGGSNSAGSGDTAGSPSPAVDNSAPDSSAPGDNGGGKTADVAGTFKSVNDMLGASQDLYDLYARPINSSDEPLDLDFGMGIDDLVGAQINNDLSDVDGTFGDKSDKYGMYIKQGGQIVAATDYTYDAASFGNQEGDRIISNGEADLVAGSAWFETSTERSGAIISNSRYDYQFKDGALTALEQTFSDVGAGGGEYKTNTVKFIFIGDNSYQFAVGTATIGTAQTFLAFDPAKDAASMKTVIQDAGYTIKYYGDVSGGTLNMQ